MGFADTGENQNQAKTAGRIRTMPWPPMMPEVRCRSCAGHLDQLHSRILHARRLAMKRLIERCSGNPPAEARCKASAKSIPRRIALTAQRTALHPRRSSRQAPTDIQKTPRSGRAHNRNATATPIPSPAERSWGSGSHAVRAAKRRPCVPLARHRWPDEPGDSFDILPSLKEGDSYGVQLKAS